MDNFCNDQLLKFCARFVEEGSNQTELEFLVTGNGCGTEKVYSEQQAQTLENILIIQNDPAYQEEWDLARLIACRHNLNPLPDLMQRRVIFRPDLIDNLDVVSVCVNLSYDLFTV